MKMAAVMGEQRDREHELRSASVDEDQDGKNGITTPEIVIPGDIVADTDVTFILFYAAQPNEIQYTYDDTFQRAIVVSSLYNTDYESSLGIYKQKQDELGQMLVDITDNTVSGTGTYERDGCIYSSLAGYAELEKLDETGKTVISVRTTRSQNLVPTLGGLVTCRITQATPRFCKVDIIAVEDSIFETPFRGLLRKEDVRPTEKDKVEIHKCFRPGDIVLSRIISIGDSQSYIVSTAENELGVIIATSEAGLTMLPISWREMQCPKTKSIEFRKVAKPTNEHLDRLKETIGIGKKK